MDESYDENLSDNIFFQILQNDYRDVFLKSIAEGCVICVPRSGSMPKYMLTLEDFFNHIIIPSEELPETHFRTLNGKDVKICNRVITVEHEVGHQSSTHLLFEETFYTEDYLKYKVLCLEEPLEEKSNFSHCLSNIAILKTLRDCMDLLWIESGDQKVLEKIDKVVANFLAVNWNIETKTLQNIIDLTGLLYTKCLQIVLKDPKIKEKTSSFKHVLNSLKIAVENYMHHGIYSLLIKGISSCSANEDVHLNKIIRNLSDIQLRDLGIKSHFYDVIPKAKLELSKIDAYSTILGKTGCLKKMLAALSKQPSANVITADDLLPILVFLIIKTNLPNWNAHLKYLKYFRFSVGSNFQADESSFLITSLEAAIEHIQSGVLLGSSMPEGQRISLIDEKNFEKIESITKDNKTISYFFQQIWLGNLDEVKKMLSNETESKNHYFNLCHPLCNCQKCKSLISKDLCDTAPTINSCDDQGLTALHIASMYGKPKIVEYLLLCGANPNVSDCNGTTPIHYAAMRGHQNTLLLLAYAGADVNAQDNCCNTPLHFCSTNGHENCVKALIYFCEHSGIKLNINAQNSNGDSPLHSSARWGYVGIVKILLENHAIARICNRRKLTPFHYAHNSAISELLNNHCDKKPVEILRLKSKTAKLDFIEEPNEEPKNVIYALKPNSSEQKNRIEKALRAIANGDINLTCFYLGIDLADFNLFSKFAVYSLEENGNSKSVEKCHPLCSCAKCGNNDETEESTMIQKSKNDYLNINYGNSEGLTPLHVASMHGRLELAKLFIQKGAFLDVQTRSGLVTPLMYACRDQRLQMVEELLRSGCSIDLQDWKKCTALHYACWTGNTRLVEILMKYEPDIKIKNCRNKTALDEANESMALSIVQIIKGGKSLNLNGL